MGRELKRVPLDFDWPLNVKWAGYLNPFYSALSECHACAGSGYAPEAKRFHDEWYGNAPFDAAAYGATPLRLGNPVILALATRNVDEAPDFYAVADLGRDGSIAVEARRLFAFMRKQWSHHLIQADVDALTARGRLDDLGPDPTPETVNTWSLSGMGHDGCNESICIRARCEREGFPVECDACKGDGEHWPSRAHRELVDRWEKIHPPEGEGFQLWETTSEGSPASPVFETLDALCVWAADNATVFADDRATAEEWQAMLEKDFVHVRVGNAIIL